MAIVIFQHEASEDAGQLGCTLGVHGHQLRVVRLDQGQPVPADLEDVDGIVSMGGPMNVADAADHPWMQPEMDYLKAAHAADRPVVGICLGAQLIAAALGGQVGPMDGPEVGFQEVRLSFPGTTDPLHVGIGWTTWQFHLHGQEVKKLPAAAVPLAGSQRCKVQAFRVGLRTYGFQYHFEWTYDEITVFARNALVVKAGTSADQIVTDGAKHFDDYRRLGDRLCENIATFLMPAPRVRRVIQTV